MAAEDAPQALLALSVSITEGFRAFTFVVNLALPAGRLPAARLLHDAVAWQVRSWLVQEATHAHIAGRLAHSDEFTNTLCRLQQRNSGTVIWGAGSSVHGVLRCRVCTVCP